MGNNTKGMPDEIMPFSKRAWLSSPTMHGDGLRYMKEAFDTNWG